MSFATNGHSGAWSVTSSQICLATAPKQFASGPKAFGKRERFDPEDARCYLTVNIRPLNVKIQEEFMRMRAKSDRIDLIFRFVLDPLVDDVLGKHIALEQEV